MNSFNVVVGPNESRSAVIKFAHFLSPLFTTTKCVHISVMIIGRGHGSDFVMAV